MPRCQRRRQLHHPSLRKHVSNNDITSEPKYTVRKVQRYTGRMPLSWETYVGSKYIRDNCRLDEALTCILEKPNVPMV